ncbi:hypothetical protein [Sorangium sp. So ce176]|uniref:hypothetical protein n=1 Tax=Sorangium sp. So ce176 TaxID=3133286 RepID=UPI003F61076B
MTDSAAEARVTEVANGIYQLHTPVGEGKAAFSFNQYLLVDDAPLLFHTGPRRLFPAVRVAIARVMPVERLRYVAFSHCESDECGFSPTSTPGSSRRSPGRKPGAASWRLQTAVVKLFIAEAPGRWPSTRYGTRRVRLTRFPYLVVYRDEPTRILVVAIAHAKQRPGYWRKR